MPDSLPTVGLIILSLLFSAARFENQRWIRARAGGLTGSSEIAGLFVNLTGLLSLLFAVVFLAAYGYDEGLVKVITLIAIMLVGGLIISTAIGAILKGDNLFIWILGTVGIWPLAVVLFMRVTWFGAL